MRGGQLSDWSVVVLGPSAQTSEHCRPALTNNIHFLTGPCGHVLVGALAAVARFNAHDFHAIPAHLIELRMLQHGAATVCRLQSLLATSCC
jgi:hypothetical protein